MWRSSYKRRQCSSSANIARDIVPSHFLMHRFAKSTARCCVYNNTIRDLHSRVSVMRVATTIATACCNNCMQVKPPINPKIDRSSLSLRSLARMHSPETIMMMEYDSDDSQDSPFILDLTVQDMLNRGLFLPFHSTFTSLHFDLVQASLQYLDHSNDDQSDMVIMQDSEWKQEKLEANKKQLAFLKRMRKRNELIPEQDRIVINRAFTSQTSYIFRYRLNKGHMRYSDQDSPVFGERIHSLSSN